jgi:retron-type reverse transcriptase
MKRANNLIGQIAEPENLRWAFWKAQKGKRYSRQVNTYRENLDAQLLLLREQILSGKVQVGDYHYFKIYDPKEREICASAFSEQVLHHALMNICHPHFERVQIFDSYASRPEKGVHAALRRAATFNRKDIWFLKLDVRKFFATIHHETLKTQLGRMFKDDQLLYIFDQIIDSYGLESGRGLPIGNLTSQYFANHYLAGLDHFIKEQLGITAYVRYMDDLILWHPQKEKLKVAKAAINSYVEERLHQQLKPILLNAASRGLPFCGYLLHQHHIRLSQRSKKRFIKKMEILDHCYKSGAWDEATCQRRVLPLIAFTRHADAKSLREDIVSRIANKMNPDAYIS